MKKEELTQKYMEFQLLNQQIQQSQQQFQMITQQVVELKNLNNNLSQLSKVESGSEMYNNLGVGVHVKSTIKDFKNLLVNVGSGVFVQKSPKQTIEILDKQITELEKFTKTAEENMQKTMSRAEELKQEIAQAQEKK